MEPSIEKKPRILPPWQVGIGEMFLVFGPAFLLIKVMGSWVGSDPIRSMAILWIANVLMLVMVGVIIKVRNWPWRTLGLTFGQVSVKDAFSVFGLSLLVLIFAVLAYIMGPLLLANLIDTPQGADFSRYDFLKDNPWGLLMSLIGVYIVSSFGEEVIYRAYLIHRISELTGNTRFGLGLALILSAVIFGLVHYEWALMGMIQTGFMGLAMGISYLVVGKKLWVVILAHAYMDTILLVQLYLANN